MPDMVCFESSSIPKLRFVELKMEFPGYVLLVTSTAQLLFRDCVDLPASHPLRRSQGRSKLAQ